jgi:predicted transcriptional regulator of viral defense system
MDNFLLKIYNSKQTVFSSDEIAILTKEKNLNNFKSKLSYYVKNKSLKRVRKGFFTKNEQYNKKELATKIYKPSYVSFETVLREEGLIFQYYETIFIASYLSRKIENDGKIVYRKLKNDILLNKNGIVEKEGYFQATKERAFLDMIYLYKDYYFDNLRGIDWETCFDLVKIYNNKALENRLKNYFKKYAR